MRHEVVPEDERHIRVEGRDWTSYGLTLVGPSRLSDLQGEVERIVRDGVRGDFIETGVWRGGTVIFMKAALESLEEDRRVFAADSFQGLPVPDPAYPADGAGPVLHDIDFLAVSQEEVRRNCDRYGVGEVEFVEGWFKETLPKLQNEWALIRLDGDYYESTIIALESLYPGLSAGGVVIVDDYHQLRQCSEAVHDFRAANNIESPLQDVDWTAVKWVKE